MAAAIRWEATNAYLSASAVDTTIYAGHDLSYIYRKPNLKKKSKPYQLISPNEGGNLVAQWYEKDDAGVGIEREVAMSFEPNEDVRRWETAADTVDDHGWRLDRFEVLDDSYGGSQRQTLAWDRNYLLKSSSSNIDSEFLSVPAGREVFHCEYVELPLYAVDEQSGRLDTSIAEGKFVARNFVLGAYLPTDDYECANDDRAGKPDCSGVDIYNPCHGTGKTCSAIDGLVYCGTELLHAGNDNNGDDESDDDVDRSPFSFSSSLVDAGEWTERNGAMIDWEGEYAYLKSERTSVALKGAADGDDIIYYSFEDDFDRDQSITSGTNGQQIGRTYSWVEDGTYRGLTFSFQPNEDSDIDEYNPKQDAAEHGWAMTAARAREQNGSWLQWQAAESSNQYEDEWISVPRSDQLFFCQSVELNFGAPSTSSFYNGVSPRSSVPEAKFIGRNVLIGAYLDGADVNRMEHYNPCGAGRDCRVVNTSLFCDGRIVQKREVTGSDISWLGYRSFLEARNVKVSLDGFDSYTFQDDRRRDPLLDSGRYGSTIGWVSSWYEEGIRRQMQFQLSRNDEDDETSGWHLESLSLLDNRGRVIQYEPSSERSSVVSIPAGFDSFHCDYVEFTLTRNNGRTTSGKFEAEHFALGGFLRSSYQYGRYRGNEYNPCRQLGYGYDEKCSIVDDNLRCGDDDIGAEEPLIREASSAVAWKEEGTGKRFAPQMICAVACSLWLFV